MGKMFICCTNNTFDITVKNPQPIEGRELRIYTLSEFDFVRNIELNDLLVRLIRLYAYVLQLVTADTN